VFSALAAMLPLLLVLRRPTPGVGQGAIIVEPGSKLRPPLPIGVFAELGS